jgi:outer membrane lipoprotein SlyB
MIFKKGLSIFSIFSISIMLSGCAPDLGGSDYKATSVGEVSQTYKGQIVAARTITIHARDADKPAPIGTAIGGVGGALIGSQIGGGKGSVVAGGLLGLGGAFAGHFIEKKITEQKGMEYQIQLDNGELITISQGIEPQMGPGQRVAVVVSQKGRSRVVPDNGPAPSAYPMMSAPAAYYPQQAPHMGYPAPAPAMTMMPQAYPMASAPQPNIIINNSQ